MKIRVSTAELTQTFRIWLTVIAQRRPGILRELWQRRGEPRDKQREESAHRELAREFADRLSTNQWEVMRKATPQEEMQGYETLNVGQMASMAAQRKEGSGPD